MNQQESHAPNVKLYLLIFAALMVLTVVTVTVSYFHLPPAPAIAVGLMIATVKAGLVAAFFMHLKGERTIIYGLLGLTVLMVIGLFVIPFTDSAATASRRIEPMPMAGANSSELPLDANYPLPPKEKSPHVP